MRPVKPLPHLVAIRSVLVTQEAQARQNQVWERLFAEEQVSSEDKPLDSQGVEDDESSTLPSGLDG